MERKEINDMKQVIGERGTGKSMKLMEYAQANGFCFVCADSSAAYRKFKAIHPNEDIKIITYEELLTDYHDDIFPIVLDDANEYIKFVTPYDIKGYGVTVE
mgnify:FL=1